MILSFAESRLTAVKKSNHKESDTFDQYSSSIKASATHKESDTFDQYSSSIKASATHKQMNLAEKH